MNFFDGVKNWWSTVANKDAVLDRIFNKETLYAIFIGGSTLGMWQMAPDKVNALTALFVSIWSIYKLVQRSS